jgi:UDP-glucose:(heptosyl)LPS alpha-1,3-glucosyltransferase
MKVALIRRRFSEIGGAELYAQRLLQGLSRAGHQVSLFTEAWDAPLDSVTVRLIPNQASRARRLAFFAAAVKRELAKEHFDCVLSLERTACQDVYRAGDGVHRVWLQRRREFAPWYRRPFVGWGAFHRNMMALEAETFSPRHTRHIIANSEMVKNEILRHFKFPADRIHIVRNGINLPRFQQGVRSGTRAQFGVRDDEFLLLFVGTGWERKGLSFLLKAAKAFTNEKVKLLVVGKGTKPYGAGPNVIFAGPMAAVEHAYAAADLFTFLPIYEPSANVCFEALAAGLPVVTSSQNGAGEVLREGQTGSIIASPADIPAIVRAIRFWKNCPAARLTGLDFDLSMERNVAQTISILEKVANERSTPVLKDSPA